MNKRLARLKEVEAKNRRNSKTTNKRNFRSMILVIAIIIVVSKLSEIVQMDSNANNQTDDYLILINSENVLPSDFEVVLDESFGKQVDYRILKPLEDMISAAKEDGVELIVTSAYRSVNDQKELYEITVNEYLQQGYNQQDSEDKAGLYVQLPAESEHHTGLAIDFITTDVDKIEDFAKTPEYEWLSQNAVKYGFIERYPKDKVDITKISWEPWHYRYVGVQVATDIGDMCLEEYLIKDVGGEYIE